MSDPISPPHPPTKSEIESALVVVIREEMADPNITPTAYERLKHLLGQLTNDPGNSPETVSQRA